jgi:hypothetical protein
MRMKETILKMPAWKAAVVALLLMFSMGVVIEEIFIHTVFHVFDRMIIKMGKEQKEDIDDMDDMDKHQQAEYCNDYQMLLKEKADLAKRSQNEFSYDFAYNLMKDHDRNIKFAITHHYLNLSRCQNTLKGKVT